MKEKEETENLQNHSYLIFATILFDHVSTQPSWLSFFSWCVSLWKPSSAENRNLWHFGSKV